MVPTDSAVSANPDGIVVIGAGWAGLAAAVELARHGLKPVVLESARHTGGRARSLRSGAQIVDNGRHVLLGSYHSVLALLKMLGIPEASVLQRLPLGLSLRSAPDANLHLHTRRLPAPLHLLWALASAHGLGVNPRLGVLRLLARARLDRFDLRPDVALSYYLRRCRQNDGITRALWQPLCRATLGTDVDQASARLFLRVVHDVFFGRRANSDLLIPRAPLVNLLPRPAMEFIETHGGSVRVGTRVTRLAAGKNGAIGGVHVRNELLAARHVILATGPEAASLLLRGHRATESLAQRIGKIDMSPVCTLYLRFARPVTLPHPFIAVLDGTLHWIFDTDRNNTIAAVIGGDGPHMILDDAELTRYMLRDVVRLFPDWPAPRTTELLREKQALFPATPENNAIRPGATTRIKGLWLAGDYTATGYPGTLEGAVRSGIHCARRILRLEQPTRSPNAENR